MSPAINEERACVNLDVVVPLAEYSLLDAAPRRTGPSDFGADDDWYLVELAHESPPCYCNHHHYESFQRATLVQRQRGGERHRARTLRLSGSAALLSGEPR